MKTILAKSLRWADEILADLADEAMQRISWFGLEPQKYMDSPGGIICDLLPFLEGGFSTNEALDLPEEIPKLLFRIKEAIIDYQQEVGLDPDPALTIDHPKWRAIRTLAKQVHELLFGPQKALLERAALNYEFLSVRVVAGCRLYSQENALRLLEIAHEAGFGCLWIEEWDDRPGARLGRHMIGDWTERGIKHLGTDWVRISHEAAHKFLREKATNPVPSFWVYPWRFRNKEAAH